MKDDHADRARDLKVIGGRHLQLGQAQPDQRRNRVRALRRKHVAQAAQVLPRRPIGNVRHEHRRRAQQCRRDDDPDAAAPGVLGAQDREQQQRRQEHHRQLDRRRQRQQDDSRRPPAPLLPQDQPHHRHGHHQQVVVRMCRPLQQHQRVPGKEQDRLDLAPGSPQQHPDTHGIGHKHQHLKRQRPIDLVRKAQPYDGGRR